VIHFVTSWCLALVYRQPRTVWKVTENMNALAAEIGFLAYVFSSTPNELSDFQNQWINRAGFCWQSKRSVSGYILIPLTKP
jgi:hypothetical protein